MKKIITALLHFDKKSKESVEECQCVGMVNGWLIMMLGLGHYDNDHIKPVLTILKNICESKKTMTEKIFELEAVECDFSELAKYLGLLNEGDI